MTKPAKKSNPKGSPTLNPKEHPMKTNHSRKEKAAKPNRIAAQAATRAAEAASAPAVLQRLPPGSRARSSVVREQAEDSFAIGERLAAGLEKGGWTEAKNQGLRSTFMTFDEIRRARGEAAQAVKQANLAYDAVTEESTGVRDQLVAAVRIVTQGEPDPFASADLKLSQTYKGTELSNWFETVIPILSLHSAAITPYLQGDPVEIAQAQGRKIIAAQAAWREARKLLPAAVKKQQAAKMKLAAAIEEQRLAAIVAYPRNKEVLSQFIPAWDKRVRTVKKTTTKPVSNPVGPSSQPSASSTPPPVIPEVEKKADPEVKATPH